MNSLNLLSGRAATPKAPRSLRRSSYGNIISPATVTESNGDPREALLNEKSADLNLDISICNIDGSVKTPLTSRTHSNPVHGEPRWLAVFKRTSFALVEYIQWILTAIPTPCSYLKTILYDENGQFAPLSQICKLCTALCRTPRQTSTTQVLGLSTYGVDRSLQHGQNFQKTIARKEEITSAVSKAPCTYSTELPESDLNRKGQLEPPSCYKKLNSINYSDNISPAKYLNHNRHHDQSNLRSRKLGSTGSTSQETHHSSSIEASDTPNVLQKTSKSPNLLPVTRFSYSPPPPRPLLPRSLPSYSPSNGRLAQKTLVLDLDETLIHSMAKGGRMSTGHMVEVKLSTIIGAKCGATPGPQHPILYWVNKRPHCDEFLRLVYKWYNLVIFTASVQEYADPVIDLLEQERKVFSNRYYRQHCILKHGAFVKDLSLVEPDLSKVMILDNSPLSYMFHQDNAIPIEGWINDPTDNNLMHLLPLLESLQHVKDVRAFLALRGGERGRNT
ncbi:NIF domain protein/NIF domain-containing protein [Blumeria hordei DH14]|uniref:NIF domain protein/NIF domain-containing protein n=1 Tax=Blumeria graminis f. sp. hordei (strain DH14) TaxID=546991 RepID=N1JGQ9_BLUG1|nr:NIF domain protein/NIF domain-containing protein [Blumeria hordei DH14]